MWAKLDDALIDHSKIFKAGGLIGKFKAGGLIGKNGPGLALGFYALCLMWTNKHLTDGFLPEDIVGTFPHIEHPLAVADALVKAELFEKTEGGYQIHDFEEFNPSAKAIKRKRREDRERKRNGGS